MAVDLTTVPWNRLAMLAPVGTSSDALQAAATRWALTADVYAAAADLWEELLFTIDISPDPTPAPADRKVQSVSQDGISVTYADESLTGNNQSTRIAQAAQIRQRVRQLRARSKPSSPLVHNTKYNPWTGEYEGNTDVVIPVIP